MRGGHAGRPAVRFADGGLPAPRRTRRADRLRPPGREPHHAGRLPRGRAGVYDLQYGEQDVDSSTAALGVEGRYAFQTTSASIRPYWLVEWRQALDNHDEATINYVVLPRANDYVLGLRSYNDNTLALGAGVDMAFSNRWSLSFLVRREQSQDTFANMFGFRLSYGQPTRSILGERILGQDDRLEVVTGSGGSGR